MNATPPRRQPAGTPVGGQFATSARSEAAVSLAQRTSQVEEMDHAACMDFLNAHRGHPALSGTIVSAEYPVESLRSMVAQVRDHEARNGASAPADIVGADVEADVEADLVDDVDGYTEGRKAVEDTHALLTDGGFEHLDPEARYERRMAIVEHFEHEAVLAANAIPAHALPNPHHLGLNKNTGRLIGAAAAAAKERIAAQYDARPGIDAEVVFSDALVEKALDTRGLTSANGVPFCLRLVRRGQPWGLDGHMTASEDMVFVFDARYPDFRPMIGHDDEHRERTERNGQLVATYAVSTLRSHRPGAGIALHGGVDDWTLDADSAGEMLNWLDRRAPLHQNRFADCDDLATLEQRAAAAQKDSADIDDIAHAARFTEQVDAERAVRAREIARGWSSIR